MTAGAWRSTATRWLKFNLVGGMGIAVQLLMLVVLKTGLHLNYLIATALAVETAVVHNFLWHERFTWADRAGAGFARFLKFNLSTGLFSIAGNLALMKLLAGLGHMNYLLANAHHHHGMLRDQFPGQRWFCVCRGRDRNSVHVMVRLALDRPYIFRLLLEGIHVDHPAEYLRHEFPSGGLTSVLGGDGAGQAELRIRPPGFAPSIGEAACTD